MPESSCCGEKRCIFLYIPTTSPCAPITTAALYSEPFSMRRIEPSTVIPCSPAASASPDTILPPFFSAFFEEPGSHPVANCSGKHIMSAFFREACLMRGKTRLSVASGSSHIGATWAIASVTAIIQSISRLIFLSRPIIPLFCRNLRTMPDLCSR